MKTGSIEWYRHMDKQLMYHVTGMKAINAVPKVRKAQCIIALTLAVGRTLNSSDKDFEESAKLIRKLQSKLNDMISSKVNEYLGN